MFSVNVRQRESEKVIGNKRQIYVKSVCMTCCVPPCVQCDVRRERKGESDREQETICENRL